MNFFKFLMDSGLRTFLYGALIGLGIFVYFCLAIYISWFLQRPLFLLVYYALTALCFFGWWVWKKWMVYSKAWPTGGLVPPTESKRTRYDGSVE